MNIAAKQKNDISARNPMNRGDRVFDTVNIVFWVIVFAIIAYPLWFIVIASVSDYEAVYQGKVLLVPSGFSLSGYAELFKSTEFVRSYINSIVYTVLGTGLSVMITLMASFSLTQKFKGKGAVLFIIIFTMFFSGGLIPSFLINRSLGLYNNPLALVILNAVNVFNIMVARTYMATNVPNELYEAAYIDGASQYHCFFKVTLPLCGVLVTVLSVYYGVARWNDYFTALVYIRDRSWLPLQTILREAIASVSSTASSLMEQGDGYDIAAMTRKAELLKYCSIVVSSAPMITLYLILQKYFVKGVTIGSLKG